VVLPGESRPLEEDLFFCRKNRRSLLNCIPSGFFLGFLKNLESSVPQPLKVYQLLFDPYLSAFDFSDPMT